MISFRSISRLIQILSVRVNLSRGELCKCSFINSHTCLRKAFSVSENSLGFQSSYLAALVIKKNSDEISESSSSIERINIFHLLNWFPRQLQKFSSAKAITFHVEPLRLFIPILHTISYQIEQISTPKFLKNIFSHIFWSLSGWRNSQSFVNEVPELLLLL